MQFFRYGAPGAERPAVRLEGTAFDLTPLTDDITPSFLAAGGLTAAADALARGELPVVDVHDQRVGPPITRPGAVICIGQNYAAHAAESGSAPPAEPVVFFKHPGCVVGPFDDVQLPPGSTTTDWEVELCVVLGGSPRYLTGPGDALSFVAGYTIANDVSERTYQRERSGGQWSKGKCCPTFNPLGPYLVAAASIADPQALRLRSFVNGDPRQDSNTADMIFSVAHLIWHLSHFMVLEPGDIINTGTPEGVAMSGRFPYLHAGDVMTLDIEGLGSQRSAIVPAPTA